MTLTPLLAAPAIIQLHVAAALGALALGAFQFAMPKGSIPHRLFGWAWTGLIAAAALSSLFIHTLLVWGPWSPLHLLSLFTLGMLVRAIALARRHEIGRHRRAMFAMYGLGVLLPTAVALLLPHRIMNTVVFGG